MVLISATRHRDSNVPLSGADFGFWERRGGVALSTPPFFRF